MSPNAAITVLSPREDVERLWQEPGYRPEYIQGSDASVRFADAPGDRGTEIHVELQQDTNPLRAVQKLTGSEPRAKVLDDLRRFKQRVETGVITRSEGSPEGELAKRKLKQRPAQPLSQSELDKAGA